MTIVGLCLAPGITQRATEIISDLSGLSGFGPVPSVAYRALSSASFDWILELTRSQNSRSLRGELGKVFDDFVPAIRYGLFLLPPVCRPQPFAAARNYVWGRSLYGAAPLSGEERRCVTMDKPNGKDAMDATSVDDPAFQKKIFTQAFEQTCKLLDEPQLDNLDALILTYRGRNGMLDKAATTYAAVAGAECQSGCSSCCHQMVLCTPFEVFLIAQYLLDTKSSAELDGIKDRLKEQSLLPLDPDVRYDAKWPCALLEKNLCTIYERRPSVCRTMLSASRAACEKCLASNKEKKGEIPYIAGPSQLSAIMQLGIDYAVISRCNLTTERVELSRAVLVALNDFDGALETWRKGGNPFADGEVRPPGYPSNREIAETAGNNSRWREVAILACD